MGANNCTVVVNSCDNYEDVWLPFFVALTSNWGNCPYKIVLNTESKEFYFNGSNISTLSHINPKEKDNWGKRLRTLLKHIDTEYVILLFDDFIMEDSVSQAKIDKCLNWMENDSNITVFYFLNTIGKNIQDERFEGFERVPQRQNYRLNSSPALWRKEKLLQFTGNIDNPWAWEFFGSARTYKDKSLFYCANIDAEDTFIYNYKLGGAIHRGKWVKSVIDPIINKYNLKIDLSLRGIEDETLKIYKHSLKWKFHFLYIGFKMIGLDIIIFIYRAIKKRIF